jgi:hypothetical protein
MAVNSMNKNIIRRSITVPNICGYLHRMKHFFTHFWGIL